MTEERSAAGECHKLYTKQYANYDQQCGTNSGALKNSNER
jgi:hypothetical protein